MTDNTASIESNPFVQELVIHPAPSRLLLLFILFIHIAALLVLFALPGLAFIWLAVGAALTGLSLFYYGFQYSAYGISARCKKLYWREFGGWEMLGADNQHIPLILSESSYSHIYFSVLNFKTRPALGNKRFTIILLPDNCNSELRRYLRMRMKLLYVIK